MICISPPQNSILQVLYMLDGRMPESALPGE